MTDIRRRDQRIDFLRGFALLTIFVDHVPGNLLGNLTLRNFGFCDAAEIFVLLAGYSSWIAYGRCFAREGVAEGLRRVALRCLRLYVFQLGLLGTTLVIVSVLSAHYGPEANAVAPLLKNKTAGLARGLVMTAQPNYLNILPLYVVLLAAFPMIYAGLRRSVAATLGVSVALWGAANVWDLNLPNLIYHDQWFFSPLAWQLLFTTGAVLARQAGTGGLPRWPWLKALAWGYLAFALLVSAPWRTWGWSDFNLDWAAPLADGAKTFLSPFRLADALALVYVLMTAEWFTRLAGACAVVTRCGRHSLEVFSLGTLLALLGRLCFERYGTDLPEQIAVNGVGLAAMMILAFYIERGAAAPPVPRAAGRRPQGTTELRNIAEIS
jgi:hypothetical protein